MSINVKRELEKLVETIKDDNVVKEIYLFGSYAYGTPNEDSDIDIAVITKEDFSHKHEIYKKLALKLYHVVEIPMDLLIFNDKELVDRMNGGFSLERNIITKGVKLYG